MKLKSFSCSIALMAMTVLPITGMAKPEAYFDSATNILHLPEVDAGSLGSFSVELSLSNPEPIQFSLLNATPVESTGEPVAMYRTENNSLSVFNAIVNGQLFNAELQESSNGFELTSMIEDTSSDLLGSAPSVGGVWNVIPGLLKQVSVGAPQHVWGVNSNNDIFRRDGTTWTHIGGVLKQVSVGCDGTVWGVNPSDQIFRWDNASGWTQIGGNLSQISVGNQLNVWGVNSAGNIFRWNGSGWEEIGGVLTNVSAGCDGTVWGVNGSGNIFRRDYAGWTQISGVLKQVSVGDADNVWGVNAAGATFKWNRGASNWTQMPGILQNVSIASGNTAVWGIQSGDTIVQGASLLTTPDGIQQRSGTFWNEVGGSLKQISVGNASNVWGVNLYDDIYQRSGNTWVHIPGKLKHVSVGCDGTTWGVSAGDYIYRRDGATWTQIGGLLKQISVGSASHVWGVNYKDDIFQWNGSGWVNVGGNLKHVSVGCDGTVWGVNASDDIFRRDGSSWTNIGGKLKQIEVGSSGHVWGSNANDDIFQWNGSTWIHITGKAKNVSVGNDGTVWGIKNLSGTPKSRVDMIRIDMDGDGTFEQILQVIDQGGNKYFIYKPLAILYTLKVFGINLTQTDIDRFSPVQRQALAAQSEISGLTVDASGNVQSFDPTGFNNSINNIKEMQVSVAVSDPSWTQSRVESTSGATKTTTTQMSGSVATVTINDNQGNSSKVTFFSVEHQETQVGVEGMPYIAGTGQHSTEIFLVKAENTNTSGPVTTTSTVVVGSATDKAYINDKGMAFNKSVTAVAVDGTVGARNSTHVVGGVGVGEGGGVAASWGQNGLYGFETEVYFFKVGVYVSGSDATNAYNDSRTWLVGAANNTADWSTQAWHDTSTWFANTADTTGQSTMQFVDKTSNWAVNAYNDGQNVTMSIIDETTSVTLQITNATTGAVNTVTNSVDSAIQTGSNIATDVGNTIKDVGSVAGSTITSTADTVVNTVSSGANTANQTVVQPVVNFFCGIFGC